MLIEHPGEEMGPTQIAAVLDGRSAGAIANALDKLVLAGTVAQTRESPRRYTATT